MVNNYGKNGITANESRTFVIVENNVITGRGPVGTGDAAQNGVQLGFGAHGHVSDNTITDNFYTPPDAIACGVLLFLAAIGMAPSNDNTFAGNEQNVCGAVTVPVQNQPFQ